MDKKLQIVHGRGGEKWDRLLGTTCGRPD